METLKLNREFKRAYNKGKYAVNPYFVVYCYKNNYNIKNGWGSRIGITATKKVGKAVQRNRARRLIRESFKVIHKDIASNFDFVIVARTKIFSKKSTELAPLMKKEIDKLVNQFNNKK